MTTSIRLHPSADLSPLGLLVEDYLDSCRARGLALGTIERSYGYALRDVFLPWCTEHGLTQVTHIDQRNLDRFTASLLRAGKSQRRLSPATVHSYIRPIRQLLAWATREGEVSSGARPQLPRLPRTVVEVLSRAEIDQLEAAATTDRDRLIIRVLADTGLRVSELCGLRPSDVNRHLSGALLHVEGKGGKHRLVPLSPKVARRLDAFCRRKGRDAPDAIFCTLRRDSSGEHKPLTRNGVLQMLKGAAQRAEVRKRVYPHLLRHSFATEALRRGMGPLQLADVLGHSGLQMIQRSYSHLNVNDAYDAVLRVVAS